MKEFEMTSYKIGKDENKPFQPVTVILGIEMEYLVSYWYIGTMQEKQDDYLFYNNNCYLYLEDVLVESITTSTGENSKEGNGIKLSVYGEIAEGKNKGDISKEIM